MRALGLLFVVALAARAAGASTPLSPSFSAQPLSVNSGQMLTLVVQVANLGGSQMLNVSSSVEAHGSGAAYATLLAAPGPFSAPIAASSSVTFTWVFSSSGCGNLSFSAFATGYNSASSLTETAGPADSNLIPVTCYTATPSPTVTPTPTPSPTPWIIYGTATPGPLYGDANIPGNLFHPDLGQPLQLRFSAPLESTVQIDLYSRIGGHVRHFERSVSPGSYTELWDGRDEQGLTVATGIYVAQFKAKGLFKTVKFAVVK
jgi:hypothetical protein